MVALPRNFAQYVVVALVALAVGIVCLHTGLGLLSTMADPAISVEEVAATEVPASASTVTYAELPESAQQLFRDATGSSEAVVGQFPADVDYVTIDGEYYAVYRAPKPSVTGLLGFAILFMAGVSAVAFGGGRLLGALLAGLFVLAGYPDPLRDQRKRLVKYIGYTITTGVAVAILLGVVASPMAVGTTKVMVGGPVDEVSDSATVVPYADLPETAQGQFRELTGKSGQGILTTTMGKLSPTYRGMDYIQSDGEYYPVTVTTKPTLLERLVEVVTPAVIVGVFSYLVVLTAMETSGREVLQKVRS